MGSLISKELKAEVTSVFHDLHDTWKRSIIIYIEQEQSVPVSSDYNPLFGGSPSTPTIATQNVMVAHTGEARIFYADRGLEDQSDSSLNIPTSQGLVRLKVNASNLELIKQATRVEIDGDFYTLEGDPHPQGPFETNYFIVYLKRIN